MRNSMTVLGAAVLAGGIALFRLAGDGPAASAAAPPDSTLTAAAWLALLPDGETKRRFLLDCAGCHALDARIMAPGGAPRSRESWVETTRLMLSFAGAHTGFPVMAPSREAEPTADWLVRHLTGAPPTEVVPAGTEAYVVDEFDLPRPDLPHDVAVDPEGRVVVTGMFSNLMYVLDPEAGTVTEVEIPVPDANPRAIEIDAEGTWWVVLGGPQAVARYRPDEGEWRTFGLGLYPHEVAIDSTGRVWFNGHFTKSPELIGVLDPGAGDTTLYEVPVPTMPDGGSTIPYGLRVARDGTVWMTELIGGRLVRFDPGSEEFALYPLPTPYSGPRRLDVAADGTVWIPEFSGGKLARFDPEAESFAEIGFPVPDALPYVARVDDRANAVWVATGAGDLVARYDVATGAFEVVPLPTRGAIVRHLWIDPRTSHVWGAYASAPPREVKVFRIRPR